MKMVTLSTRTITVSAVLILAASVIFMKGCGSNSSGGCSSDAAPDGYTITALTSALGAPLVGAGVCYQPKFLITDKSGNPANNICVEVRSGPFGSQVAKQTAGEANCTNITAATASSLVTNSDSHGVIALDFVVTSTATGQTFFIDAASGAAAPAELTTAPSTT